MSTYPKPNPMDNPFSDGLGILKKELSHSIDGFFSIFEKEAQKKSCMSRLLNLHEKNILMVAKEVGGMIYQYIQKLMQLSADFANGHGKIESVYECLEKLRDELKN